MTVWIDLDVDCELAEVVMSCGLGGIFVAALELRLQAVHCALHERGGQGPLHVDVCNAHARCER